MGIRFLLGGATFLLAVSVPLLAQETRSMLFGRVLDPQGGAIVDADVVIRNAETGVALPSVPT